MTGDAVRAAERYSLPICSGLCSLSTSESIVDGRHARDLDRAA